MTLARLAIGASLCAATLLPATDDPVLLLSRRAGAIEAMSLDTLETTARVEFPGFVETVASDPSGRRLFVALPSRGQPKGCCALYALDLPSLQLTFLAEPAIRSIATFNRVVFQRGNVGIESFDTRNLARLATLETPGVYQMKVSPDGRWLFGTTSFQGASLDLFDLSQGKMIWKHPFEDGGQDLHGAWIGQEYYLFSANRAGHGRLWSVNPDNPVLQEPLAVSLPGNAPAVCQPVLRDVLAAGDRLVIYDVFGDKLDRRHDCPQAKGGFVVVDPKTGTATERLAASDHFFQLVASADGRYLYGLDMGGLWTQVRIVKMDAASGGTIRTKKLDDDVWFLTKGVIPSEMEGHLDLSAVVPK